MSAESSYIIPKNEKDSFDGESSTGAEIGSTEQVVEDNSNNVIAPIVPVVSSEEAIGLIGSKVIKEFAPFGIFKGTIKSYEEPYFNVIYEDGDGEDVDIQEIRRILLPNNDVLDHVTIKHLKHPFWCNQNSDEEAVKYIGRLVSKNFFRHGMFHGKVTEIVKPYFKITYEDGDEEDIDIEELLSILITENVDLVSPYINFSTWLVRRKKMWGKIRQESRKRDLNPETICEGLSCACKRAKYSSQMNWPVERLACMGRVLSTYCSASIAERVHSLNPTSVFNSCHGQLAQTGGHRFQFQEVRLKAFERLKWIASLEGYEGKEPTNEVTHVSQSAEKSIPPWLLRNKPSKHKGVWWHAGTGKWISKVLCDQFQYHIGSFSTEASAISAYESATVRRGVSNVTQDSVLDVNETTSTVVTEEVCIPSEGPLVNHRLLITYP